MKNQKKKIVSPQSFSLPAGCFAGMKCSSSLNEKAVRKITSIFPVISGISLILKNL